LDILSFVTASFSFFGLKDVLVEMVAFLLIAWKGTNEVGLPLWHFVRKDRQNMNPLLQEKIKNDFSLEWCHWNIYGPKKELYVGICPFQFIS
jgi:hypothetical protein